jgi:AraC-like DNA-binding protein
MHHRYVLIYVLKTGGVVSVDGLSLRLKQGDALLIFPFQFHYYLETNDDALRWLFLTFELDRGSSELEPLRQRVLTPNLDICGLIQHISSLWAADEEEDKAMILPLTDQLLSLLRQESRHLKSMSGRGVSSGSWIAQVESLVIQSVHEGWSLEEVSARMGYSSRRVRDRFEKQTGMSLKAYRNSYQFHRALSLFRDSQLSLSQIAEMSGFQSQPVFNRFIRRLTGETPGTVRKQVQAGSFSPQHLRETALR